MRWRFQRDEYARRHEHGRRESDYHDTHKRACSCKWQRSYGEWQQCECGSARRKRGSTSRKRERIRAARIKGEDFDCPPACPAALQWQR
jgi:hypothetical protein